MFMFVNQVTLGTALITNMNIDALTRQVTIDYGKLNRQTARESQPIPCVEDIMHFFDDCEYFCILNAFEGRYQITLSEEDEEKTGFSTPFGIFCHTIMPANLENADATYRRMMRSCLKDQIGRNAQVYTGDVIIVTKTEDRQ